MASPTGVGIARGLERGLSRFLEVQAAERDQKRRDQREERLQEEHEARLARRARERTLTEAEAASRGITLPGVERTREAGPQAMVGDRELRLQDAAGPGLELRDGARGGGGGSFFEGADLGGPGRAPSAGDARPELSRPTTGRDGSGLRRAMDEEIDRQASGGAPSPAPGALDPETGLFTDGQVFGRSSQRGEGPGVGEFLEEGHVERRGPEFRLSSGAEFRPEAGRRRALREEMERIREARPDLSESEAAMLARGRGDVLTFDREEPRGLDDTFNVHGKEIRDLDEAVSAYRAFGRDRTGGGREGRSLTQTERVARQYGFDTVADYRRFQDRVESLQGIYGTIQGDPLLQRALENRARGLSETEVIRKVRRQGRENGLSQADIERAVQDVRGYFAQRSAQEVEAFEEGNIGGIGNMGSGFDLDLSPGEGGRGPAGQEEDSARRTGGRGPLRNR